MKPTVGDRVRFGGRVDPWYLDKTGVVTDVEPDGVVVEIDGPDLVPAMPLFFRDDEIAKAEDPPATEG